MKRQNMKNGIDSEPETASKTGTDGGTETETETDNH